MCIIYLFFFLLRNSASNSIAKIAASRLVFRHKAVSQVTIPLSLLYFKNFSFTLTPCSGNILLHEMCLNLKILVTTSIAIDIAINFLCVCGKAAFTGNSETLTNTFYEIYRRLDDYLSRHLPILRRRVCIVLFRPALSHCRRLKSRSSLSIFSSLDRFFNSTRPLLVAIFFTFSLVTSFFFFTEGRKNRENWPPWTLFRPICSTFCCNFKIICLSELECKY